MTAQPTRRLGGFSDVARELNLSYTPRRKHENDAHVVEAYRQMVYTWWKRRRTNGFPEHVAKTDSGRKQFDLDEVLTWYANYEPSLGGRTRVDRGSSQS